MTISATDLHLRQMGLQDLQGVVEAHSANFPRGFFARLGRRFLTRYYRTFLDGPLALAIVAEMNGDFVGYLVGILDPPQHRQLLLTHHGLGLAVLGFLGLVRHPVLLSQFVTTRVRRYYRSLTRHRRQDDRPVGKVAVLSHVVVVESCRSAGVGTVLVQQFVDRARAASCERAHLVTVAGAHGAGSFYEKLGWTHATSRRGPDGQTLAYYERRLAA